MNNISAIDHLYAFEDGDTITPGMGVRWVNGETGLGLQQYWNPTTGKVIATDFKEHPVMLYPQPYSSKKGAIVLPEANGQQWYYGNISTEGGILQDGAVKEKFKNLFEVATVEVNGKKFPALKIKENLATAEDHTDKYIYYSSSYDGKTFVCQQLIPIQQAVGEAYQVLISVEGASGSGDNVLSEDNDWIKFSASLLRTGEPVVGDITFVWQRFDGGEWKNMSTIENVQEVSANSLKVYDAAVEGVDLFRCVAGYAGKTYYGMCEATDIHDPYYIDKGCSNPSGSVSIGETVTYNPQVYERASGEVSSGWRFAYSFTDSEGNAVSDVTEKTLTYDNIKKHNGLAVRIEASK